MVLWLPSTWFEELGLAKRTSRYEFSSGADYTTARPGSGVKHRYVARCYIRLPNGRIEEESASMIGPDFYGAFPKPYKAQLKARLKEQVRRKYAPTGVKSLI